jgi:flagellar biosynthetic protein FliR
VTIQIGDVAFVAFLLALVRSAAWIAIAPPFNHRSIPVQVRAGLAAALALALTPWVSHQLGTTVYDTPGLIGAFMVQALAGAGLGVLVLILMSAVQSAGSMLDLFGGFTISSAYDPFDNAQAAIWGRFYDLLAVVLLFVINGHLLLLQGFITSFQAVPLHAPPLNALASTVLTDVSTYFAAAVEVAAPLLAALFLAQVVMGMVSRAAPQMNVLSLSFPFMILLTILLASLAVPQLPGAVSSLAHQAVRAMASLSH